MKDTLLDTTFEEWKKYYKEECRCNFTKECKGCKYKLGGCCLGDVLDGADKPTLREILENTGCETI